MAAQKHTPGPWLVLNGGGTIARPTDREGNEYIAEVFVEVPAYKANARLIAAAPEMYEALKVMVNRKTGDDAYLAAERKVLAAIAKAEGR